MLIALLPITLLLALCLLALAVWALIRAIIDKHRQGCVPARHTVLLIVCCTLLWLGISSFFLLRASLQHSAHPLLDAWPKCLVGFLVLICAPVLFLVWPVRRKSG